MKQHDWRDAVGEAWLTVRLDDGSAASWDRGLVAIKSDKRVPQRGAQGPQLIHVSLHLLEAGQDRRANVVARLPSVLGDRQHLTHFRQPESESLRRTPWCVLL